MMLLPVWFLEMPFGWALLESLPPFTRMRLQRELQKWLAGNSSTGLITRQVGVPCLIQEHTALVTNLAHPSPMHVAYDPVLPRDQVFRAARQPGP